MESYLRLQEVAHRLGVSERTVRRYVTRGELPGVYLFNSYRVREEDLNEYVRQARVKPGPKATAPPSEEAGRRSELEPWIMLVERTAEYVEAQTADPENPAFHNAAAATAFMDRIVQEARDILDIFFEATPGAHEPFGAADPFIDAFGRLSEAIQAANRRADLLIGAGGADELTQKREARARREQQMQERVASVSHA